MGDDVNPVWSQDGKRIAFASKAEGYWNVYWTQADGLGTVEPLTKGKASILPASFSPDGSHLMCMVERGENNMDLEILPLTGSRELFPFFRSEASELFPEFSPDGKWVAYSSWESGKSEVYVRSFPDNEQVQRISTNGGVFPCWTKEGRELIYLESPHRWMSVQVRTNDGKWLSEDPELIFDKGFVWLGGVPAFDVSADGERFVVLIASDEWLDSFLGHRTFIFNFFDHVQQLTAASAID